METLLKRYPNLGAARLLDALAFAHDNMDLIEADLAREQALFEQQGGPTVGARPLAQLALPFFEDDGAGGGNAGRGTTAAKAPARAARAEVPSTTAASEDAASTPSRDGGPSTGKGSGGQRARGGRR
ncbi:Hypothetical protein CAP_8670 [Chondromyces apiculatus DSM 436]|uniref:Uncharacterized protein n=1 Tax=Chondromyces apiculatus DSM 436 TaxID=1192034 RepID=A0A017TF90_9BACT|nr:Hypothetical protein CAP_8670 [Chondromyces apiculatus DSM 436]